MGMKKKRREVLQDYQNYVHQFPWNRAEDELVPIIPVLHGTSYDVAVSISKTGFVALSNIDAGWYGKGIYFSTNAYYCLPYMENYKNPAALVAFVFLGHTYPVVESPDADNSLLGCPLQSGFNSHYVLTNRHGGIRVDKEKHFAEIVVEQESQILPAFILCIDTSQILDLMKEFHRDIPKSIQDLPISTVPSLTDDNYFHF